MPSSFPYYQYLKYYLSAKNKHSIHSPFVYRLLTKAITPKNKTLLKTSRHYIELKKRLIEYLNPKSILEIGSSLFSEQKNTYYTDFNEVKEKKIDFIYLNDTSEKKIVTALKYMHNDSVLVLNNLYKTKENWQKLKDHSQVRVSINLFQLGIIFMREEQEKQHFTIRF
jgi:hypothetical protein